MRPLVHLLCVNGTESNVLLFSLHAQCNSFIKQSGLENTTLWPLDGAEVISVYLLRSPTLSRGHIVVFYKPLCLMKE